MEILNDRKYSPKHTWAKLDGEYAYIGVTDFAQDQLGERSEGASCRERV